MNQKKPLPNQLAIVIIVTAFVIIAAVGVGYLIGKKSHGPEESAETAPSQSGQTLPSTPGNSPVASKEQPASASNPQAQTPGRSAAEIAKSRGVPAILEDPNGSYELVAVIEGEEANRRLTSSLQVIGGQRQRLLNLSRQYDGLPADSVKQRELLAGEILTTRQTLTRNLQFVARNYGYSLKNEYRLVPHSASLFLISKTEGEKPTLKNVHNFTSSASYTEFRKMRDNYLLLSVTAAKQAAAAGPAEAPVPEEPASETPAAEPDSPNNGDSPSESETAPLDAELQTLRETLIETYQYDPSENHQINFKKTVLYARPAKR